MTGLGECRVEPQDNSVVLFPSRCVHEVTLLECDPTDFGTGHFSVNTHVWDALHMSNALPSASGRADCRA